MTSINSAFIARSYERHRSQIRICCIVLLATALLNGCNSSSKPSRTTAPMGEAQTPRATASTVPVPEVSGPISGGLRGRPWQGAVEELSPLAPGYIQEEYFFSGTANGRDGSGKLDGSSSFYTTRMLVQRPKDLADFNGSVFVEWYNVTPQMDVGVLWALAHAELLREGYAYVGMSVQQTGVSSSPLALKYWDPQRYAPLNHPGDGFAFSILAQGVRALLPSDEINPLGDLIPQRIIAAGESQSAGMLLKYINLADKDDQVFDGYFIHTFPGNVPEGVPVPVLMLLAESEKEGITSPVYNVQDILDLVVPLSELPGLDAVAASTSEYGMSSFLHLVAPLSELPGLSLLGRAPEAPEADFNNFKVWEIAGGSHFDKQGMYYVVAAATRDLTAPLAQPVFFEIPGLCAKPINELALERPTKAALHALNSWMESGVPPGEMPRIQMENETTVARDADGLALGGIRMPTVSVPVGVNEGETCVYFGSYSAFSTSDILSRYPTREAFLSQFNEATENALTNGWLLPEEAAEYISEADDVDVWGDL